MVQQNQALQRRSYCLFLFLHGRYTFCALPLLCVLHAGMDVPLLSVPLCTLDELQRDSTYATYLFVWCLHESWAQVTGVHASGANCKG